MLVGQRCLQRAGVRRSINLRVVITFVARRAEDSAPYLFGNEFGNHTKSSARYSLSINIGGWIGFKFIWR